MPIFEFKCPKHGKFEQITLEKYDNLMCPKCGELSDKIEFSVPAKRNPECGIQK
jgi:putative FmdB family regulatory protein